MKFNLKNHPVKASPQAYERWIKGFEEELRDKLASDISFWNPQESRARCRLIEEILGE